MTEAEWLACADPGPMLRFLRWKGSSRRWRLFACACCRQAWHPLADEGLRTAVELAERYADELASAQELAELRSTAGGTSAWVAAKQKARQSSQAGGRGSPCALLRDLFGPLPFRAVSVEPAALAWD